MDIICTFVRYIEVEMTENRNYLHKYAMHFGTYMGVYWVLKFILFPLGFRIPFLSFLYMIMTLAVPVMGYYYVRMYRDKINRGVISFAHAGMFTLMMYAFASLLAAVAHYVYFQFIDQGFLIDTYTQVWHEMLNQNTVMFENKEMIEEAIEAARGLSSIDITMQLVSWDIFWGAVLAIPTGLMVMRKARPEK